MTAAATDELEDNTELEDDTQTEEEEREATPEEVATIDCTPKPIVPRAQLGIIRGLAASLAVAGTLVLVIAKVAENELLVTVQPIAGEKEDAASALPIQVNGTPDELDEKLIDALAHYVPAREIVTQTAAEIAQATVAAAARQKAENIKRQEAYKPKTRTAQLTVKVTPAEATITVADTTGKTHEVKVGKPTTLPIGKYTIAAAAPNYIANTTTLLLSKNETTELKLEESKELAFALS
jgi:PRTRC genetic system protein E